MLALGKLALTRYYCRVEALAGFPLALEVKASTSPFQLRIQEKTMSKQAIRLTFAVLSLALMIASASGQTNLAAKANNFQPQPSTANGADNENDRVRDGLIG